MTESTPRDLARNRGAGRRRRDRVGELARRLPAPSPSLLLLAGLVVAEWVAMLGVGRIAQHNGWFYFHGGDATWYYTSAWVLAHGHIPQGYIAYGYPLLIAPIAYFAGPDILVGTPAIVILNAVVLAPIALLCIFGIARMIGGRTFAYVVSLAWIVFPVVAIHYFVPSYHFQYVDETLPPALGLTARGDFPSLVLLLAAAYFAFRLIARPSDVDAVGCGFAIGLAIVVKPSNALFLPAAIAGLLVARRARGLGLAALGLVPSLIGLALWKDKGLGDLPLFPAGVVASPAGVLADVSLFGLHVNLGRYLPLNWGQLSHNLAGFRTWTQSLWLVVVLTVGGVIGLARRSLAGAALVAGWLASFVVIKGSSSVVNFDQSGTFLTHMIPAFPAFFLLLASLPLLVPRLGRRLCRDAFRPAAAASWPVRAGVSALGLLSVVGMLVVVVLPPLTAPAAVNETNQNLYLPVGRFPLAARVSGGTVTLRWPSERPSGSGVSYGVFRDRPGTLSCRPVTGAAAACTYPGLNQIGSVTEAHTSWTDHPPAGRWVYRVALSSSPSSAQHSWDYIMLSRPVAIVSAG